MRALSTHLFANRKLTPAVLERIEAGRLPAVEIFCARQHFDYADRAQVREVAAWFAGHSLQLRSLHGPIYSDFEWGHTGARAALSLAELEPVRRREAIDHAKRALEVAERVPFRYMVQHLGVPGEEFDPRKFDAAQAALEELHAFARPLGVDLLLENIPNQFSTAARLREFIERSGFADLRVCFDTGHAHLGGGVAAEFEALRGLVVSTHLHDNNGADDDHRFPFQGTIDWEEAMRALAAGNGDFPLQLELRDYGEFADPLAQALDTFDRLEALVAAPQP
jgi:sugar phosphate isomerase/epimerase